MKKYSIVALTLVLTAAILVGCGCTNQNTDNTSAPTVLPTNEEVRPTTEETSRPTTVPTTVPTQPSETIDRGNGALEDTTSPTSDGIANGSARNIVPNMN